MGWKFFTKDGSEKATIGLFNVTRSAYAGGPPSGARDGDFWIATDAMAVGNDWMFQYKAGDTYPWHFVGGAPVRQSPAASTFGTSWASIANIAVRAGDWNVRWRMSYTQSAGNSINEFQIIRDNNAHGDLSSGDAGFAVDYYTSTESNVMTEALLFGVATRIDLYASTGSGVGTPQNQSAFLIPVRIA